MVGLFASGLLVFYLFLPLLYFGILAALWIFSWLTWENYPLLPKVLNIPGKIICYLIIRNINRANTYVLRLIGLDSPDPQVFVAALSLAGAVAIPELEYTFESCLWRQDRFLHEILKALGNIRSKEAIPFLSDIMNEGRGEIRLTAADTLGLIDHETATESLIRGIEKNEYIALRGNLNWYEANSPFIISSTAVSPLIDALKNSHESGVRRLAAITLGEIGDKRAIQPLIAALNENSDFVSNPSADALVKIGVASTPDLHATLNKESVSNPTRYRIALILVDLGDFRAIHHLMPYLKSSGGDVVRNTIRKVLVQVGKVKGEKATNLYIQTCKLNPHDEATRTAFLGVLDELDLPRIVLDLTNLSHSPLQYFLLEALGELGVPLVDIEHDLIRAANNNSWKGTWQDIQIIKIFGEIGSVAAIPNLLHILSNNQRILAGIAQNPTEHEYIRALIKDFNNWYVEKAAVEALGKIKANAAVPALTHILTFDDKKIVAAITTAFKTGRYP
ncbi:MAG: HEAT repeat domain-containing protein [Chloroflexi bacterium]|nr:HEAT repeat domain-containing protein [Chloroflexota bacterium]